LRDSVQIDGGKG